jgi:DNA primase catalytic subunit
MNNNKLELNMKIVINIGKSLIRMKQLEFTNISMEEAIKKVDKYKATQMKLTNKMKEMGIKELIFDLDNKEYKIHYTVRKQRRFCGDLVPDEIKDDCMIDTEVWLINFN